MRALCPSFPSRESPPYPPQPYTPTRLSPRRLTTILVSRFLLHLQSAKYKTVGSSTLMMTSSRATSIMFDRVIGSLDQSLSVDDFLGSGVGSNRALGEDWPDNVARPSVECEVFELPLRSPSIEK